MPNWLTDLLIIAGGLAAFCWGQHLYELGDSDPDGTLHRIHGWGVRFAAIACVIFGISGGVDTLAGANAGRAVGIGLVLAAVVIYLWSKIVPARKRRDAGQLP